jgi:hypothetical protein
MTMPDDALAAVGEDLTPKDHLTADDRDIEAPEADAVEQATPVDPSLTPVELSRSVEVNEYDAPEQARVVDMADDY